MKIFCARNLNDSLENEFKKDKDLSLFTSSLPTPDIEISTISELHMVLNNLRVYALLKKNNLITKQKTESYDAKKSIRFCLSPISGIQVWGAFKPTDAETILTQDDLDNHLSIMNDIVDKYRITPERLLEHNGEPLYLSLENYELQLTKLGKNLVANDWIANKSLNIPQLFPLARSLPRKVIVFAGPTSSGKTYHALSLLKSVQSGLYLGPLRLNALEVYDELNEDGVVCNLITGEEKCIIEGARHQASTAEMADYGKEVDVVVIDEVQFVDDPDRGWAFCNALIGAPSRCVVVTCPEYAIEKIEKICDILGDDIEVHRLPRKTKLSVTKEPLFDFSDLEKGTAIVSFSRKRVFQLKAELEKAYKISVVYGGMPPDVRKEQARRFREGDTDILIATDCIGIGLNLPLKTVVFDTVEKFDGQSQRRLFQSEVLQIGGRAGRFNIYDEGFVTATKLSDFYYISECFSCDDSTELSDKYYAKIPYSIIAEYMDVTGGSKLSSSLKSVYEKITYDASLYDLSPIEVLYDNLKHIESFNTDLDTRDVWRIGHIPLDIESCEQTFADCLMCLDGNDKGIHIDSGLLNKKTNDTDKLFDLEKLSVQLDCVSWFLNRYPEFITSISSDELLKIKNRLVNAMNDAVLKLK